ncbi:chromate transporter [Cryobacterium tagatosivorans]|uniref:Chromate transporter n=1 Tax=Cryobacterium tagatosivorans TaxID=1259199 RepID=A0A4R8UDR3_9MICO|nr:chromate transporter [Cryobacterium tagatosivorans]TFB51064.1 chromate transporter [Cryobacterium tagatosivorans]
MLKVGVVGFGGGSALIPVMERHGDREHHSRGSPVKLAALSGVRVRGPFTALVSAIAVALPGTVLTVALLAFFASLGSDGIRVVEGLSLGVTAFILFLLAHYAPRVLRSGGVWHVGGVVIAAAVFLTTGLDVTARLVADLLGVEAVELPRLSAVAVILLAIAAVAAMTIIQRVMVLRSEADDHDETNTASPRRALGGAGLLALLAVVSGGAAMLLLPATDGFVLLAALSTVSSFGGGEAYVAVADGFFVAPGLVDPLDFYGQIVPVANALPGPILVKVAAGIGYAVGAAAGGPVAGIALTTAVMLVVGVCAAIALAVLAGYDAARHSSFVSMIGCASEGAAEDDLREGRSATSRERPRTFACRCADREPRPD